MITSFAFSARPAFASAGRFMGPVVKEAAHDVAVGASQFVMMTVGTVVVGAAGYGLAVVGKKTMDFARSLPRPHVHVSWDPSWNIARAAPAAAAAAPSPEGAAAPIIQPAPPVQPETAHTDEQTA